MGNGVKGISRREALGLGLAGIAATIGLPPKAAGEVKEMELLKDQRVTIEAKPAALDIDLQTTAVVVVDMQNDFGTEGGMFERAGIDISMIKAAVAPTAKVLAAAREKGLKVIYLKMAFRPDLSDAGAPDSVNFVRHRQIMKVGTIVKAPDGKESRILIRDTWNTDILSELAPKKADTLIYKTRFSGFYKTELDDVLKRSRIKHLVFTGCTTSICVESTIRDAMFRDYLSILLADCTGEPIGYGLLRSNHEASLLNIQALFGWVSDSTCFLKGLASVGNTRATPATGNSSGAANALRSSDR